MKKRSFLIFLAASALMLAGCAGKSAKPSDDPTPGGDDITPVDVDITPTEGKLTFYFQLGADTPAIPSYTSIFLTGGFINWKEKVGEAIEMQKMAGSENIYVGLIDLTALQPETADQYDEFQLTLGYNATSGAPSTGVNWGYKSVECKAAGGESGMDNLHFTVADGLANLGTHNWDAIPADPAASAIHNFKVNAKFSAAVPEYVDLYLVGDHISNWTFVEATKLTPNEGRTEFVQTIDTIIGNTYGVKLMAQYNGQTTDWNHPVLQGAAGANYNMMVKKTWGDNYTLDLAAQAYDSLIIDHETFVIDWATWMPELGDEVNVDLKLTATSALSGSWEACGSWDWDTPKAATANEGNTEFTVDLGDVASGSTINFKFRLVDSAWHIAIGAEAGDHNITVNVGDADMHVVVALDATKTAEVNEKVAAFDETFTEWYTCYADISGNGTAAAWDATAHTYGVIGSFSASNWETDVAMERVGETLEWKATITVLESQQFKVRVDGAWDISWGYAQVSSDSPAYSVLGNAGGDARFSAEGSYLISIVFATAATETPVITVSAAA